MKRSTALRDYLLTRRITSEAFAESLAKELNVKTFSTHTIDKWRDGTRTPSAKNLRAIKAITGLTADQIIGAE